MPTTAQITWKEANVQDDVNRRDVGSFFWSCGKQARPHQETKVASYHQQSIYRFLLNFLLQ